MPVWEWEKKLQQPDKISYICKNSIFLYIYICVNCQTKTVSSVIKKDTWKGAKVAKICNNMSKLNQNWCLEF